MRAIDFNDPINAAIVRMYNEGRVVGRIADEFGLSLGSVTSRLRRARHKGLIQSEVRRPKGKKSLEELTRLNSLPTLEQRLNEKVRKSLAELDRREFLRRSRPDCWVRIDSPVYPEAPGTIGIRHGVSR